MRASAAAIRFLTLSCLLLAASPASAQRTLYWDAIDVTAHLDETGRLLVDEAQTIVFDGDWNGGERTFDIRPRQGFKLVGLYRDEAGTWTELTEDDYLDAVDEFSWIDGETLRWRSRMPSDPPFAETRIRYLLRYELTNILVKDDAGYLLDHDFLFADRDGVIRRFDLQFTLDPAWQADATARQSYSAADVPAGRGFVVTLPLRYAGTAVPGTFDASRPMEIQVAVLLIIGITIVGLASAFVGESKRGRFASLPRDVDETWLRTHVLAHPAEVVGAAWDDTINSAEVVALIARLVGEGKLESTVAKGGQMSLKLKTSRDSLTTYERTLIDRLFFNNRTNTSTQLVKQHYRKKGFNPVEEIRTGLLEAVSVATPGGLRRRPLRFATPGFLLVGTALLIVDWTAGRLDTPYLILLGLTTLVLMAVASVIGSRFRANIHWTARAAAAIVSAVTIPALATVIFFWYYVGVGEVAASNVLIAAITSLTLAIVSAGLNALVSRQYAPGVAFRKRLAAARAFFVEQLASPRPALHDDWYPWLLALGLRKEMDDWSTQQEGVGHSKSSRTWSSTSSAASTGSTSGAPTWTGFAGGQSGGAGGGAGWTTAVSGLAAGVAPPSSSSSGGSGGSSSSSSSSGSSGGGGGGGW
jgi:hypothetical protein